MKKTDKHNILDAARKYAAKFDGTIRFHTVDDENRRAVGYFYPKTRVCVVVMEKLRKDLFDTICHELAHLEQYAKYGATSCSDGGELEDQHYRIQQRIEAMFTATGYRARILAA